MTLHTQSSVQDYFKIENLIASSPIADLFSAIDRSRNSNVHLWLIRAPLKLNSESVKTFLARLKTIAELDPPVVKVNGYGVDSSGVAFVVLPPSDGHLVYEGSFETFEAERRFISCINLIRRLHERGIYCGDLSGASFWKSRDGDIRLLGVVGYLNDLANTISSAPVETKYFTPPEILLGKAADFRTDVFGLAVLAYFMFTKRYPFEVNQMDSNDKRSILVTPSQGVISPPVWLDEVLTKALSFDPGDRYKNCIEMVEAINSIRVRVNRSEAAPTLMGRMVNSKLNRPKNEVAQVKASPPATKPVIDEAMLARKRRMQFLLMVAGSVTFVVIIAAYIISTDSFGGQKLQTTLEPNKLVSSEELQGTLSLLSDPEVSIQEKTASLEKIAASDDPIMYDALIELSVSATSENFRKLCEKVIIDRARRFGLVRTVEVVRSWLEQVPFGPLLPPIYEPVLRAMDSTLPHEARDSSLRESYAHDPNLALRLAAALGLDSNNIADFQGILSQLVGDSNQIDDTKDRSPFALIFVSPVLSTIFADDVIQRRQQIPDSDILWLLQRLADRGDTNIRPIASSALDRGLVPPIKRVFLTIIRDRSDIPHDVLKGLVKSALGTISVDDIGSFGRWYDLSVEKVLLSVCAFETNPAVLLEAFDTVAARSLSIEPSSSIIEWVRKGRWQHRMKFISTIGALSVMDILTPKELEEKLGAFDKYIDDPILIGILLDTGSPEMVKAVVKRFKSSIGLGKLLGLLDHPDKDVRVSVIKALKGYNDIAVLKIIIDYYGRETDESVKQIYKDSFWFIRERVD